MPISKKILKYLDDAGFSYQIVSHRKVFTAYDAAQTMHIKVSQIAKNLLVKAGAGFVMVVLPADRNLNFEKLAKLAGVKKISMPKEGVMQKMLKVKPGALPAFAGVYKLPVFVDKSLFKEKKLVFSSGSFTESIEMTAANYKKLENPHEGNFSVAKKIKKPKIVKKKISKKSTSKPKKKVKKTVKRKK